MGVGWGPGRFLVSPGPWLLGIFLQPQGHSCQDHGHCSEGSACLQRQLHASLEAGGGQRGSGGPAGAGGQVSPPRSGWGLGLPPGIDGAWPEAVGSGPGFLSLTGYGAGEDMWGLGPDGWCHRDPGMRGGAAQPLERRTTT